MYRLYIFNINIPFFFPEEYGNNLTYLSEKMDVDKLFAPNGDLLVDNHERHILIMQLEYELNHGSLQKAKAIIDKEKKVPTFVNGTYFSKKLEQLKMMLRTKEILAQDTFSTRLLKKSIEVHRLDLEV